MFEFYSPANSDCVYANEMQIMRCSEMVNKTQTQTLVGGRQQDSMCCGGRFVDDDADADANDDDANAGLEKERF